MPCNASYARFIFGKFFTSTIILYVLLFAQKVLFLQKVGVTAGLGLLGQAAQPLGLVAHLGEAGEALGYDGAGSDPARF
jgi:hypothetical protein